MVCPSKTLRNKRRLLSFLLRKLEQKENIRIDIFEFMNSVYKKTRAQDQNSVSMNPETRFVPLIATFQKSSESYQVEEYFLQNNFLKPKVKELKLFRCSIDLLSSNETRDRGFTHRFKVSIILRKMKNVISAREFISQKLCDFKKPYLFDDGSKLFFTLDPG